MKDSCFFMVLHSIFQDYYIVTPNKYTVAQMTNFVVLRIKFYERSRYWR